LTIKIRRRDKYSANTIPVIAAIKLSTDTAKEKLCGERRNREYNQIEYAIHSQNKFLHHRKVHYPQGHDQSHGQGRGHDHHLRHRSNNGHHHQHYTHSAGLLYS
jgi:hypothetical protein